MAEVPPQYSNYPRPNFTVPDPIRPPGIYWETISWAFDLIRKQTATWVASTLVLFAVVYGVSIPFGLLSQGLGGDPFTGRTTAPMETPAQILAAIPVMYIVIQMLASLVSSVVQYILLAGVQSMAVKQIRGEPISVGDIFAGFGNFGRVAGAATLAILTMYLSFVPAGLIAYAGFSSNNWMLIAVSGFVALATGLFTYGALSLAPLVALGERCSATEAISLSFKRITLARLVPFSFFLGIAGMVAGLGILACCVGMLYTYAVFPIVIGFHYTFFFPPDRQTGFERIGEI